MHQIFVLLADLFIIVIKNVKSHIGKSTALFVRRNANWLLNKQPRYHIQAMFRVMPRKMNLEMGHCAGMLRKSHACEQPLHFCKGYMKNVHGECILNSNYQRKVSRKS